MYCAKLHHHNATVTITRTTSCSSVSNIAGRGCKIRLMRHVPPINKNNASTKMGSALLRFTITLRRAKVVAPGNQLERPSEGRDFSAGEGAHFSGTLLRASFRHTNLLGEAMAVAVFQVVLERSIEAPCSVLGRSSPLLVACT